MAYLGGFKMARSPRIHSYSKVYHVMIRGINRQTIFYDKYDYIQFIKFIYETIIISEFELYAYCLMSNHVHMLIKADNEPIELLMKRLELKFVYWYNEKYNRTGHLFESRYKSEPVDDEKYFLTVLRYILQNPVKAQMCDDIFEYPWSSAGVYLSKKDSYISNSYIYSYFKSTNNLIDFLRQSNNDECLEDTVKKRNQSLLSDEEAIILIKRELGDFNITDILSLKSEQKKELIRKIPKSISSRQIARITGLSKSQVNRMRKVCG